MHRRARHLNPKDLGAACVYDARYITGISDNTALTTWQNRTGTNDATQPDTAQKPVYKANQLNGNPVVEFTASDTDRMLFNKQDASQAWGLFIVKRTSTNAFQNICTIINVAGTNATFAVAVHNDVNYGSVIGGSGGASVNHFYGRGGSVRQDEWRSLFFVWLGGGSSGAIYYNAFDDGTQISLTNSGNVGASTGANSFIGNSSSSWGGPIAAFIVGFTGITGSLRKRLNHSAAFSFKLICS